MPRIVLLTTLLFLILLTSLSAFQNWFDGNHINDQIKKPLTPEIVSWKIPDIRSIPGNDSGKRILYGRDLIVNTAYYLGPEGIVMSVSNGLNCQNCHLDAGTRLWGNNFGAVASLYPKFRERSGTIESIEKKINDCFERSMNGKTIDSTGREMQAMIAYIKWLGSTVEKGVKPYGSGAKKIEYAERAADTVKGRAVFMSTCATCHGINGGGKLNPDNKTYMYPPLWGPHSYNYGAGIYRLSKFAAFIKYNMPFGVTHDNPILTDEQAWDVAAFVNSQPRPGKDISHDWPDITRKPVDHPFGPYADIFSETQHKYGPFAEIEKAGMK